MTGSLSRISRGAMFGAVLGCCGALSARGAVVADLAGNYADGVNFGTSSLPDSTGTGFWKYYQLASGGNPGSGTLTALTASGSIENGGHPGYVGSDLVFGAYPLPAVSASNIFSDGATPPTDYLAWHPGDTADGVLQWQAGAGEAGNATVSYTITKANEPGTAGSTYGSIQYRIYVNSTLEDSGTLLSPNAYTHSFTVPVAVGDTVSFVTNDNGNLGANESDIQAQISVPEPASLAVLIVGAMLVLPRRRK